MNILQVDLSLSKSVYVSKDLQAAGHQKLNVCQPYVTQGMLSFFENGRKFYLVRFHIARIEDVLKYKQTI